MKGLSGWSLKLVFETFGSFIALALALTQRDGYKARRRLSMMDRKARECG